MSWVEHADPSPLLQRVTDHLARTFGSTNPMIRDPHHTGWRGSRTRRRRRDGILQVDLQPAPDWISLRAPLKANGVARPHAPDIWVRRPSSTARPKCDRKLRPIATVTDPETVRKILVHLGVRAEPLPRAPARDPTGQTDFDFDAA